MFGVISCRICWEYWCNCVIMMCFLWSLVNSYRKIHQQWEFRKEYILFPIWQVLLGQTLRALVWKWHNRNSQQQLWASTASKTITSLIEECEFCVQKTFVPWIFWWHADDKVMDVEMSDVDFEDFQIGKCLENI